MGLEDCPRIDGWALTQTGLIEVVIPASVEIMGEGCFSGCISLASLIFESGSRLSRIEAGALCETGLIEIVIPASVVKKLHLAIGFK
jgi:hypothetical protein